MAAELGKIDPMHQFMIHPMFGTEQWSIAGYNIAFTNSALWMLVTFAAVVAVHARRHEAPARSRPLAGRGRGRHRFHHQHDGRPTSARRAARSRPGCSRSSCSSCSPICSACCRSLGRRASVHGHQPVHRHRRAGDRQLLHRADRRLLASTACISSPCSCRTARRWPMLPLIFLIELVSFMMRPFSLGLRLFVAMIAGPHPDRSARRVRRQRASTRTARSGRWSACSASS